MQSKQGNLEDDIKTLKKYKKIVNNSMALQCKHCAQSLLKENFQDHLKSCMEESDRNRVSVLLPQGATGQRVTSAMAPSLEIIVHQCILEGDSISYEI